jgi:hypothetical protein
VRHTLAAVATRGSRLALCLAAVLLVAAATGCDDGNDDEPAAAEDGPPPVSQHFESRPDLLPPVVKVNVPANGVAPGYVFISPKKNVDQPGPMILDNDGRLVWFDPLDARGVTDFRVQNYRGKPILTWWRGRAVDGVGDGYYVLMDDTYNQIGTVIAGNGLAADVHEFLITPRDTALITVYERKPMDLSAVGGPSEGKIFDGVIQEIDIETGKVLFDWHSSDEVDISESYSKPPDPEKGADASPYDYFHINSIDVEPNGNLLVSARNTHTIYEIRRPDGKILWRLGGKKSDFEMGPGTNFEWQHDARRQPDGTITLFDNGAEPKFEEFSRVLRLDVSPETRRARLVRSYVHPKKLLAGSQGSAQFLPDGHVFVGWGAMPYFSELAADGTVLFDGQFGVEGADSYRAYRIEWTGRPGGRPAVAVASGESEDGTVTVYASWNGATEIDTWQVLGGRDAHHLELVTTAPKDGFETTIEAKTDEPYVGVRALDARGAILGTSNAVAVADQPE